MREECGNNCSHSHGGYGLIIAVVLYILLAIILSSCMTY